MGRLESILDSWWGIREDTANVVGDFSAHELDYKRSADLLMYVRLKGIVAPTTCRRPAKASA